MIADHKTPLPDEAIDAFFNDSRGNKKRAFYNRHGISASDYLRAHIAALEKKAKSDLEIICNAISSNGWVTGHADTISDIAREIDLQIKQSKSQFSALTAELEIYRRNDAGGYYSNRKDRETD